MKYQAVFRVAFEAIDDIDARQKLQKSSLYGLAIEEGAEVKLQEVFENKAPRGIAAEIKAS
jgi:hypothetical protein